MKLLFALGVCIVLIVFPLGLQAGTIYECKDRGGAVTLTDTPLGGGYDCRPKQSFQDVTEEEKAAWEKERNLATEKRMQEEQAAAEAEKRKQAEEAARKKQLEEPPMRYRYW